VWVANQGDDTVQAIDGATGKTRHTVAVGDEPLALAWNGTSLWVANRGDGTLQEIDPGAGAVLRTIPVGEDPFLVAADGGRVWVAHNDPAGTLLAVDVESGEVVHELELSTIYDLAFDGDLLWVAAEHETRAEGVLIAVDPADGQIVESWSGYGYQIEQLVYDGDWLWFGSNSRSLDVYSSYDGAMVQVDDWGEFEDTIPFGSVQAVALAGNQLWVVDNENLRAVDLETHHVGKSLWLGYAPRDMVFDGERLWITSGGQWVAYLYVFPEDRARAGG
jgi:YVTN family beta-propeller protein